MLPFLKRFLFEEKAMLDYSRLMGYNTPTAAKTASIETNRVHEVTSAAYSSSAGGYREKAVSF